MMLATHQVEPVVKLAPVAVVLVNWKNAADTLACIESLLDMVAVPSVIVVCDNNSNDGSMQRFQSWCAAERTRPIGGATSGVTSVVLNDAQAAEQQFPDETPDVGGRGPLVVFLQHAVNAGFAGGCNEGLKTAQAYCSFDWVWFLNNDTIVDPGALAELLAKAHAGPERIDLIGSRIMYFDEPDRLQYAGGARANHWFASVSPLDGPELLHAAEADVESRMDYVAGASLFVSKAFLSEVGPMAEDYFLYYEELDWSARASGRFRAGYASKSVIYHREGASIGGKTVARQVKSRAAEYYATRSRVLFTARYHRRCFPTVLLAIVAGIVRRAVRGQFANARYVFDGLVSGVRAAAGGGRP